MHLHNCRSFQEHPRSLLHSLSALCKAPGGPGSIWKYLETPVRATGVSRMFACGFWTDLHFADALVGGKTHVDTIYTGPRSNQGE